ncbi:MAG: hypothetical protein AB1733_02295 [Thermodesulfobacteriota bacterium]
MNIGLRLRARIRFLIFFISYRYDRDMSIQKPQNLENNENVGRDATVFPTGLVLEVSTNNFEEMASVAPRWDQEYLKLGKGTFCGTLLGIHTASVQN